MITETKSDLPGNTRESPNTKPQKTEKWQAIEHKGGDKCQHQVIRSCYINQEIV